MQRPQIHGGMASTTTIYFKAYDIMPFQIWGPLLIRRGMPACIVDLRMSMHSAEALFKTDAVFGPWLKTNGLLQGCPLACMASNSLVAVQHECCLHQASEYADAHNIFNLTVRAAAFLDDRSFRANASNLLQVVMDRAKQFDKDIAANSRRQNRGVVNLSSF